MNKKINIPSLLQKAGIGEQTVYAAQEALLSYRAIDALQSLIYIEEESSVFLQTVQKAVQRLEKWPYDGKLYKEVLYETYLVPEPLNEPERLEKLFLSRSDYYRKKREAIQLFALALYRGEMYF